MLATSTTIRAFLATALLALCAQAAHADTTERWPRWYVGVSGMVSFLEDSDIRGGGNGELSHDTGGGANLALGYTPAGAGAFWNNTRFEAQLGWQHNSLDNYVLGGTPGNASGSTTAWSYMANVYYDFRNSSGWTPYVGAGAGGATVKLSDNSGLGNTDDSDSTFAYQLMAGLSYSPTSIPLTEWLVGYRFFDAGSPEYGTAAGSVKLDDYRSHNVELGARFRF